MRRLLALAQGVEFFGGARELGYEAKFIRKIGKRKTVETLRLVIARPVFKIFLWFTVL